MFKYYRAYTTFLVYMKVEIKVFLDDSWKDYCKD